MFFDLLPFETNRLIIHFAAFASLLCMAAYVCSKVHPPLAKALTRYAQAVAVSIVLFLSLSTSALLACGVTTAEQLSSRANCSLQALRYDISHLLHLSTDENTTSSEAGQSSATELKNTLG